jgi:GNAT superfamily N-acetyltransferase
MEIVITWYNDTMQKQVISMFEKEYKLDGGQFESLFNNFYFHPFQKNKCILIVALDGETVAGFQSFFYWPYMLSGKQVNSFQSGNSLVHPDYRGKGIFQKMLAFIDQENKTLGIDFLMGFPVEASLRNFIKDKWQNIFDLKWYLKIANPFAFFNFKLNTIGGFESGLAYNQTNFTEDNIRLSNTNDFVLWRDNYLDKESYCSFIFTKGTEKIIFHLKRNKRKKILNELIIGNILFSGENSLVLLSESLSTLLSKVKMHFHFISIAINEQGDFQVKELLEKLGFRKTERSIYFIVKPFTNNSLVLDPKNWIVYRSDIDTW